MVLAELQREQDWLLPSNDDSAALLTFLEIDDDIYSI
jgi:hypothetical protein